MMGLARAIWRGGGGEQVDDGLGEGDLRTMGERGGHGWL